MRILFINAFYPPYVGGGAELVLSNIVDGLAQRGHEVAVLTTQGEGGLKISFVNASKVYCFGIRNIYWHFSASAPPSWKRLLWHAIDSYNPLAKYDIRQVIRDYKPDIISCHNLPGFSIAAWIEAVNAKIPIVQVLHDYYSICPKCTMFKNGRNCEKPCGSCAIFRLPHTHASNKLNAVVGVSRAVLERHLQAGLFADVPLKRIINNGRRLETVESPTLNQDTLTFGFIGTLTFVKGLEPLAEAFIRTIAKSRRPMQLLIGGSGKDEYVANLKLRYASDCIFFLGHVDPVVFFNQIDITVVPSVWNDPFPGVVYESLGYGTPVIGAIQGGIPEVIQHEKNGLLYDPNDPYALDAAMLRIIEDPVLLGEMRKNSASSVRNLLNQDRMIDEHESLYEEICSYRPAIPNFGGI
jgi:glycosyltransferase involved in cell wall biosynthesis